MSTRIYDANIAKLSDFMDFLTEELEAKGCTSGFVMRMMVAAEEIFTNIASYAYPGGSGQMTVDLEFPEGADGSTDMGLTFSDSGVPFNPLAKADPDVTAPAEERPIGGLGIFMVKKAMDEVKYRYEDGHNILTLVKSLECQE